MLKKAVIVFSVLTVILFLADAVRAEHPLEDFSFQTADGKTIDFNTLKDRPMVINIGAYW